MVVGILALPGLALAGQHTVPGDVLYPIKRVVERVWVVVDDDIAAEHRVRELEVLLDRDAEPEALEKSIRAAVGAIEGLPSDHSLHEELAEILSPWVARDPDDGPAGDVDETDAEEGPASGGHGEDYEAEGDEDGPDGEDDR